MDVTNSLVFFGPAVSETTGSDRSIQKIGTKRPTGNVLACIKHTTRSNIGDLRASNCKANCTWSNFKLVSEVFMSWLLTSLRKFG